MHLRGGFRLWKSGEGRDHAGHFRRRRNDFYSGVLMYLNERKLVFSCCVETTFFPA